MVQVNRDNALVADSNLLAGWGMRIAKAALSLGDCPVMLRSEFSAVKAYSGQEVVVTAPIVNLGEGYDEEALPYYRVRAADGTELVAGSEELFSDDPRFIDLLSAVSAGFALSRAMGYVGPFDLAAYGSDGEKADFEREVLTFEVASCEQNTNTPDALRVAPSPD